MAEILGVVAGIVGIADAGFKLYLALSSTGSALGSAGTEILLFSSEVRIFAEILVVVRTSLKDESLEASRSNILDQAIGVIPGLIVQCEMVYGSMERLLDRLQPYKDSKFRLKSKLKWMQDRSKMLELRGFLESLKSSLQLLLSLIKNEVADNNREPAAIRNILREELKAAFRESKSQSVILDEGVIDDEVEQNQVARVEVALVRRTKPIHTIKEAAENMMILHNTFPDMEESLEDDPSRDHDQRKGKKGDSEWTRERSWPSQTSDEDIKKVIAEDTSNLSQHVPDGDSYYNSAFPPPPPHASSGSYYPGNSAFPQAPQPPADFTHHTTTSTTHVHHENIPPYNPIDYVQPIPAEIRNSHYACPFCRILNGVLGG
ncbi:hypothetical protein VTL71DRAFT_16307 [Oculimacula yallundae]|uniref:DUF3824 domain-containing protein n=1 Tax=Oculimacula yallundae TaxID=86028 RepID=A0ABR4CGA9_9HELO